MVHPAHVAWYILCSLDVVIIIAIYGFDLQDNPQQTLKQVIIYYSVFRLHYDYSTGWTVVVILARAKVILSQTDNAMHLCLLC